MGHLMSPPFLWKLPTCPAVMGGRGAPFLSVPNKFHNYNQKDSRGNYQGYDNKRQLLAHCAPPFCCRLVVKGTQLNGRQVLCCLTRSGKSSWKRGDALLDCEWYRTWTRSIASLVAPNICDTVCSNEHGTQNLQSLEALAEFQPLTGRA